MDDKVKEITMGDGIDVAASATAAVNATGGGASDLSSYQNTLQQTQQYMNEMLGFQQQMVALRNQFNAQSDAMSMLNQLSGKLSNFFQQTAQAIR